jgi:3-deoxy-7-phosphoheptulonate synthase
VDPSHSAGQRTVGVDGLSEIQQATAMGVIVGANMVLVDFHPEPSKALVDAAQALRLEEMKGFLDDVKVVRDTYLRRALV